jgi:type II secretory pathway pseudopilin PulG
MGGVSRRSARPKKAMAFTLLEVVLAVTIVATALLTLQATVSGSVNTAGASINRRAAREACRAKLEEILAGITGPDGAGDFEELPGFKWSASTEEKQVGAGETKSEVLRVVKVEVKFPDEQPRGGDADTKAGASMDGAAEGTVTLSAILETPPQQQAAPPR